MTKVDWFPFLITIGGYYYIIKDAEQEVLLSDMLRDRIREAGEWGVGEVISVENFEKRAEHQLSWGYKRQENQLLCGDSLGYIIHPNSLTRYEELKAYTLAANYWYNIQQLRQERRELTAKLKGLENGLS